MVLSPVTYCIAYQIGIKVNYYLYLSGYSSRKCVLKQQFSGGGFLIYMKCITRYHYSINKNKVILCDNVPFCDDEQTELLRDSPNFDGNVEID